jgi:DNA-binding CsgD family transcriptional regulator
VLDRLVEAVRAGESRALVAVGEPGAGKTALLEYLAGRAPGCQVARVAGVQSEMELAFAGLHQLCAPLLDCLEDLPGPQRDALRTAFGISSGPVPDRFLVGLAVLSLLSEAAAKRPLVCLVDDQQWLDRASAQVLAFVARRLVAESVGLVFGTRVPGGDLAGLPELVVEGLREADARELLDAVLAGPIDARVRDRIIAETRGNPLAILELPRELTAAELAGGFGLPGAVPLSGSIEESFRRRVDALPAETRRLLLLAAAEPTGDPVLVLRAAGRLGIGAAAAGPASEAGLAEFGLRVRFRHPLVRSAAYRSAPAQQRREVHRALAEVTDPELDPDRRAWHRAHATPGPDEDVAAELERSAGRARARGGLAAAAAFLERATMLTLDPARRAGRALAAAQAKAEAGAFDAARDLLAMAEAGPLSEFQQARVDLVRARIAFVTSRGSDAPPLLLQAARRLEPVDAGLSRATYLDALAAAVFAGRLGSGGGVREVAEAARAAPPAPEPPRAVDVLLDGLATRFTEGYAASLPRLRQALDAFCRNECRSEDDTRWLWLACRVAPDLWHDETWGELATRQLRLARAAGALNILPLALTYRAGVDVHSGQFAAAAALVEEADAITQATGTAPLGYTSLVLAAWRGREAEALDLINASIRDAATRGEGRAITLAEYTAAVLHNGLGHYHHAVAAAARACEHDDLGLSGWALIELVEAAARSGQPEAAAAALEALAERTGASGTDWALGIQARSRALLGDGPAADALYREAISRLGRTRIAVHLARAHLLYGEWLRRERRRSDAREQLRTAHGMLEAMGAEAFAERARRELRATGETARKRTAVAMNEELTAQEAQIARMARDGLSNPEIGARLFISTRTVQYHLGKVFTKLDISSRSQLNRVLPADPAASRPR